MRGHLRERSPGHWAIVIDTVDAATGKRKRKWHSFEGTKRQAQVRCAELIAQSKDAGYIVPSKATFAEFLTRWIEHKRGKLSAQSHKRYSELVRLHIAPALGGTPLKKIEPQQIDSLYTQLGERVSAETVIYVHRILKHACNRQSSGNCSRATRRMLRNLRRRSAPQCRPSMRMALQPCSMPQEEWRSICQSYLRS